jgi:acetyl esterase/lipase
MYTLTQTHHRALAGVILFSPEVDLLLDEPSVADNAPRDILPWNIPTSPYLHGRRARDGVVSALDQDVSHWPPTFVSFGSDEMFRDSIRVLVEHLEDAGVDTVAMEESGMFHVFPILMPWADASRRTYDAVGRFVTERLPGPAEPRPSTVVAGPNDPPRRDR